MARKRKPEKLETESLSIAIQNNAVCTNYVKLKVGNSQNSKCRLRGNKYETLNHRIREFTKLTEKEYESKAGLGWKGDPLGTVLEIKV